jgi:aminopeptidase YwaD
MNTSQRIAALCGPHPDRHVGGPGNRAANELFADEVAANGFGVEYVAFDALEWVPGPTEASLEFADGERIPLQTGPFSAGHDGEGPLIAISTAEQLATLNSPGAILLLHGEIAAEQYTPRNYPFYQLEQHTRTLEAIDRAQPSAVIAATDRTPMAAALCPFPLFEDGDFGHPSAYLHARETERLLAHAGETVRLLIDSASRRVPAEQLIARIPARVSDPALGGDPAPGDDRKPSPGSLRRIAVSAHIDSRYGTPGALDNASGVAVLMALADLLGERAPALDVELVPFNGEDDYAAPGEMAYLAQPDALGSLALAINIDAVGRRDDTTAISFYSCPANVRDAALASAAELPRIAEGPGWPMSDHMVFAMRGVPAIAVTSSGLLEIAATVAHTEQDTPELVDPDLIEEAAAFIARLIERLGGDPEFGGVAAVAARDAAERGGDRTPSVGAPQPKGARE